MRVLLFVQVVSVFFDEKVLIKPKLRDNNISVLKLLAQSTQMASAQDCL